MPQEKLKIAILGTRGVPANYGGFETFAEQLGLRLVKRGHQVTVYARRRFFEKKDQLAFLGMIVRYAPTVFHKYLETPLHAFFSFLDLSRKQADVVILCNAANSPFAWLLRAKRIPFVVNVDGIERQRRKWNSLGKLWYRVGEVASVVFANKVVADAHVIREYYLKHYRCQAEVITYGAERLDAPAGKTLEKFGLSRANYILYVSRLEPENNAHLVIQAFQNANLKVPLVVVGDAPYANEYKQELREIAGERVIFCGFQFGENYRELRANCLCYVQATEVGGTHPALVEAMAYGNSIVANDTPEHREVLQDCGLYYKKNSIEDLGLVLSKLVSDERLREELSTRATQRAEAHYSWDAITHSYEELLNIVSGKITKP
ncbi:MAG: glycosyltransferase [Bdellovibrionales bacterium]|nr:glycosyltransferase [Bdellovibrionales bacterium]